MEEVSLSYHIIRRLLFLFLMMVFYFILSGKHKENVKPQKEYKEGKLLINWGLPGICFQNSSQFLIFLS